MLKAIVDKSEHETLSADVKEHYKDISGVLTLDVGSVDGLELGNPTVLKSTLQKERVSREAMEKNLKLFEGLDPEVARDAMTKIKEMDDWDPDEKLKQHKQQFETALIKKLEKESGQLAKKLNEQIATQGTDIETLTLQLGKSLIDSAAVAAISEAKGSVQLLLPVIRSLVRMVKKDGNVVVEVVGSDSLARLSTKPNNTDPMTITELVEELKKSPDYARAFDGSGASGSGASGGATEIPGSTDDFKIGRAHV